MSEIVLWMRKVDALVERHIEEVARRAVRSYDEAFAKPRALMDLCDRAAMADSDIENRGLWRAVDRILARISG